MACGSVIPDFPKRARLRFYRLGKTLPDPVFSLGAYFELCSSYLTVFFLGTYF